MKEKLRYEKVPWEEANGGIWDWRGGFWNGFPLIALAWEPVSKQDIAPIVLLFGIEDENDLFGCDDCVCGCGCGWLKEEGGTPVEKPRNIEN